MACSTVSGSQKGENGLLQLVILNKMITEIFFFFLERRISMIAIVHFSLPR